MTNPRITGTAGLACLLLGAGMFLTGVTPGTIWIGIGALSLAGVLMVVTLHLVRKEVATTTAPASTEHGPVARRTLAITVPLCLLGLAAAGVAVAVAEGEARGHAVGHLLTGIVCLALFAALGRWWRSSTNSISATLRGPLLALLWLATAGLFLESLGGAGYDAANEGERIAFLTALHGIAALPAALFVLAAPLSLIALVAVAASRGLARFRSPA
jgi:hypothetical protein